MKHKMWFGYELSLKGWSPVVWHKEQPKRVKDDIDPLRSPIHLVPDDCIVMGEPSFVLLQERFPAPVVPE